jgi:hypothetical protein
VPVIVVAADHEDRLVASLVENCARRQHKALDLLQDIRGMQQRGYSLADLARKIIETRRRRGKGLRASAARARESLSADALVKAYQEDAERNRSLIQRAQAPRDRLLFIIEAIRRLGEDEEFIALLEEEDLDTLPQNLAAHLHPELEATV